VEVEGEPGKSVEGLSFECKRVLFPVECCFVAF